MDGIARPCDFFKAVSPGTDIILSELIREGHFDAKRKVPKVNKSRKELLHGKSCN